MKVFLDVGAHDGQTLDEVIDPCYGFDTIYAFEPMPRQFFNLRRRFGPSPVVVVLGYGLADQTGPAMLYGDNKHMEASIYPTKSDVDESVVTDCHFVEASKFVAMFDNDDVVIMKLNCEGSEALILDNLIDSGEIWKLAAIMVDFDVRKIPDQAHREAEVVARLNAIGFDRYALTEEVLIGETHRERIAHWLNGLA